ncbi:hypothetical protein [Corynebacterium epidermidicanis]|uniref:hypothetical protein n=1 Tax=Corynebacterium epidermidicanis TaxID=1050174 RepID=UPI0011875FCE|nr:hypothetical protein [Corynebacterium epidermidicanis]
MSLFFDASTVIGSVFLVASGLAYAFYSWLMYQVIKVDSPLASSVFIICNFLGVILHLFSTSYLLQIRPDESRYQTIYNFAEYLFVLALFPLVCGLARSPVFPRFIAIMQAIYAVTWTLNIFFPEYTFPLPVNMALSLATKCAIVACCFRTVFHRRRL